MPEVIITQCHSVTLKLLTFTENGKVHRLRVMSFKTYKPKYLGSRPSLIAYRVGHEGPMMYFPDSNIHVASLIKSTKWNGYPVYCPEGSKPPGYDA